MGEELGWRGFLLPCLQSRFSALTASLLVGVVWGLWHLPLFFIPGPGWSDIPIWSYMLCAVSTSVISAWIVNSTGGSTLMATVLHLALNFGPALVDALGLLPRAEGLPISAILFTLLAAAALLVGGPGRLTSGSRRTVAVSG
jgi:membrane protease YdiL (CAAX protease family)